MTTIGMKVTAASALEKPELLANAEDHGRGAPGHRPFRDLPLFWKLLLPFATLLVIVGASAAYLVARNDTARAQAALTQDLQELSLGVRGDLQGVELGLLEAANLAANLAGMADAVAAEDATIATDLLRSVVALRPELAGVSVHTGQTPALAALAPPGLLAPALESSPPVVAALASADGGRQSGIVVGPDGALLVVAAPICSDVTTCAAVGVAVVSRDLDGIIATAGVPADGTDDGIALFDSGGQLLASYGMAPEQLPQGVGSGTQLVREAGEVGGVKVQTLHAPFQLQGAQRGVVAVTMLSAPAFEAVRTNGITLAIVLGLALLGIVGVGALATRGILRQVYPLVEVNTRLGSGDLAARVPVLSNDEIGDVARGLNRMAERLQASYDTLESRVDQRTAEVQRLLKQRTEFFASLSHELRTPLAIVLGQAELLQLDDEAETQAAGRAIHQSAAQLLDVVGDILELARAESGTLEVAVVPTDLRAFIADLEPTLGGLARVGDIEVEVDIAGELPPVLADPQRLREIVLNLVDNAVKYSPARSTVSVAAAQSVAGEIVMAVSDQGRGIPSEVGDELFEPFVRVGAAPRTGGSTGLGLAITRQLIRAQGGDISYASQLGEGTTFTFTLPTAESASMSIGPEDV